MPNIIALGYIEFVLSQKAIAVGIIRLAKRKSR